MNRPNRRRFIQGAVSLAAVATLAGCNGNDEPADDEPADDEPAGEPAPDDVDEYLTANDANLYDGTLTDMTGEAEITIDNGAGPDGLAFEPAAVRIDAGTTVVWEWTGEGGAHNAVSVEGSDFEFASDDGELIDEEGHTWEFTFEEPGTALYHCEAHTAQGQHGAIVVE